MYDIVIIGAGIIGSFLAHDLSKYQLHIGVLEKESDVANAATMANSAIIHAGHDPSTGSLKARFNVQGSRMYEQICVELGVSYRKTKALVVSTCNEEKESLERLFRQALERKIPVMHLSREEALAKESNLSDAVQEALELPTTAIVSPWEIAIALMEEAVENQAELFLKRKVSAIRSVEDKEGTYFEIKAGEEVFCTKYIINAAGVYADEIYDMVSSTNSEHIAPGRGEYFVLDKQTRPLVSRVIYPAPSERGKGVLVVPTIHGNFLIGPSSALIADKEGNQNTTEAMEQIWKDAQKIVKNIPKEQIIRSFAGLRAKGSTGDFVIEEAADCKDFIHISGIESPGLSCAPAISKYVIEEIIGKKLRLYKRKEFRKRKPILDLKKLSEEEKNKLVKSNPAYGRMICRCEQITEGEIVDAIVRPIGAKTVKGVKKRVRPGMGRCQGSFCEPRVVEILARELGISPMDVRMDTDASVLFVHETKGGSPCGQ